jgi:hypothetical protein
LPVDDDSVTDTGGGLRLLPYFDGYAVEPFAPLSKRHRKDLEAQVERVGGVLGRTPVLTVGTVSAGRHV